MIATEMPAAIRPYSMAVAPSSLRRKFQNNLLIGMPRLRASVAHDNMPRVFCCRFKKTGKSFCIDRVFHRPERDRCQIQNRPLGGGLRASSNVRNRTDWK